MKVLKRQTIMNEREAVERTYGYDGTGKVNLIKIENLDTREVTIHKTEIDSETKDRIEYITELDKDHNEIKRSTVRTSFDSKGRPIKFLRNEEEKDGTSSSVLSTNMYDKKGRLIRYTEGDYQENFEYEKDKENNNIYYKYILENGVNRLSYMSIDGKNGAIYSKSFDTNVVRYYFYKHGRLAKISSVIDDSKMNFVNMYKYNRAGTEIESFRKEYDKDGKLIGVTIIRYNKDGEMIYFKDTLENVEYSYEYTHIDHEVYKSKVTNHITKEETKYSYFLEKEGNKKLLHVFINGKREYIKQWVYDDDGRVILYNNPSKNVTIRNEFC